MINLMKRFINEESGQGMTEYGLIIAVVAVMLITVLVGFKDQIAAIFTGTGTELAKYPKPTP